MKKIFLLLLTSIIISNPLPIYPQSISPTTAQVKIQNRILAQINDKVISMIDVTKQMDLIFYREFSQYASSTPARYEFYTQSWPLVLKEMIDRELILADAKEKKIQASEGEIHKHLDTLFGPDVINNLEKAQLSFTEAYQMIKKELTTQKMLEFLQFKAYKQISPAKLLREYQLFCKENKQASEWVYRVLTVRSLNQELGKMAAEKAHTLLSQDQESTIIQDILSKKEFKNKIVISLSNEYRISEDKISPEIMQILSSLTPTSHSPVLKQFSRTEKSDVFRIYILKDHLKFSPPKYNELESQLTDRSFQKALTQEKEKYIKSLKQTYGLEENDVLSLLPENYTPFNL